MKNGYKELEDKFDAKISDVAIVMSKAIGDVEARLNDIEDNNTFLTREYSGLLNRVEYLEKKLPKK